MRYNLVRPIISQKILPKRLYELEPIDLEIEFVGKPRSKPSFDTQLTIVGQWSEDIWFVEDYEEEKDSSSPRSCWRSVLPIERYHEIPSDVLVNGQNVVTVLGNDKPLIDSLGFEVILGGGNHTRIVRPTSTATMFARRFPQPDHIKSVSLDVLGALPRPFLHTLEIRKPLIE